MPSRGFWIAAMAAVLGTAGLAVVGAKLWDVEGALAGSVSGAILGSTITLAGFGMLLRQRAGMVGVFGLFFLLKLIVLVAGAAWLWKMPQFGRYEAYLVAFVGAALLGAVIGGSFFLKTSQGESRDSAR